MKKKDLKRLEKIKRKLEKKQAKAQAHAQRNQKRDFKKFVKKHQGTCPKCKHAAHQHRFIQPMMMPWFGVEEPKQLPSGHCLEKVEQTVDGMVRLVPCKCDLDPKEAQLNSDKARGMSSFDKAWAKSLELPTIRTQQSPPQ